MAAPPGEEVPVHAGNICDCGPGGIFVSGEYLLMKARRRAMDFALLDPHNDGTPQGEIESLEWDMRSGLRLGAVYRVPGDGWEIGSTYTYFHSTANAALGKPDGGTLFATLTHPGSIEEVDSAAASSSLNYNVLDAEIGRRFSLGESFCLRLFGGARFAWIDQKVSAYYDGGDAMGASVITPIDFDGGGLRCGGELQWKLGRGFGFFMRGSQSLLVGEFKTRLVETNNFGATTNVNVSEEYDQMVPVTELAAGFAWEGKNLRVGVGYELSNWFNFVDTPDFVDDLHQGKAVGRRSDLTLEALSFQVGLVF
jgi:hypothetical protein